MQLDGCALLKLSADSAHPDATAIGTNADAIADAKPCRSGYCRMTLGSVLG
jgi:hypothetical protein